MIKSKDPFIHFQTCYRCNKITNDTIDKFICIDLFASYIYYQSRVCRYCQETLSYLSFQFAHDWYNYEATPNNLINGLTYWMEKIKFEDNGWGYGYDMHQMLKTLLSNPLKFYSKLPVKLQTQEVELYLKLL